jgi:hypothetical protein
MIGPRRVTSIWSLRAWSNWVTPLVMCLIRAFLFRSSAWSPKNKKSVAWMRSKGPYQQGGWRMFQCRERSKRSVSSSCIAADFL